jgi:4-aminobutyrate--pyruvate transaminase
MLELPFYHSFGGKVPAISTELAERLIGIAPAGLGRVLFANSGSEANDTAIKLAWYVNNALGRPRKKEIIARQRAYHGVTIASASLTGLAFAHTDFDLPIARILHTEAPWHYRGAHAGESEEAFAVRLADKLEEMILQEDPDTVAAFFAEPVMGAGGVIVPPATYFERIQPILRKYDVLFVAASAAPATCSARRRSISSPTSSRWRRRCRPATCRSRQTSSRTRCTTSC